MSKQLEFDLQCFSSLGSSKFLLLVDSIEWFSKFATRMQFPKLKTEKFSQQAGNYLSNIHKVNKI